MFFFWIWNIWIAYDILYTLIKNIYVLEYSFLHFKKFQKNSIEKKKKNVKSSTQNILKIDQIYKNLNFKF